MARQTPGNYVPLDVNYARDVAVRKAGPNAELLYIRSLAYAKGARTSGFVSDFDLEVVAVGMRAVKGAAEKLTEVGLWVRVADGWIIRSWERWNAGDRIVSAGGKLGNHKRWHVDRGVSDPACEFCLSTLPIAPRSHPDSPPISPPESQGKGREGKKTTTLSDESDEHAFDEFWKRYPRKDAKVDARKAWKQVTKKTKPDAIIASVESYPFKPERQFQPLPGTWLRGQRWEDEAASGTLPMYDVNKLPEPGMGWSAEQLDMVLGKDSWTVPEPPEGMNEDDGYMWQQGQKRAHFGQRVQAALKASGRATA